jgi:hypothetical protein
MRRVPWRPRTVPAIAAGTWLAAGDKFRKLVMPPPVPQEAFTRRVRSRIGNDGINQTVITGAGTGRLAVGPQGTGTRWFPQQVTIATASGAAGTSTATGYFNTVPSPPIFSSDAGDGDVIGLAVPEMQPGDLLIVIWSGGNPGDWASVTVVGEQEILAAQ